MSYFIDANTAKRNDTALLSDNYINKENGSKIVFSS